jgi:hypothetical protein
MSAPINDFHAMAKGHNVFFYYRGYVSQTMVEACAEALKLRLESANINYPTQRRLLSSFIEMGQNVVHYSADSLTAVDASENEVRFGVLTICREGEDGQFTLTCTNPVSQRIKDKLQGKLEVLATLSVDETLETVKILKERFPEISDPPSDDICYATQNRQEAIKEISPQSDLVIVVGSQNSSNSVRLAEVALEYGAKASHLVDFAQEIQEHWLNGVETIGLTSGASVPEILVKDVLAFLAERGFADLQTITAKEETLLFSLPPELRKDLKAAGQ